VSQAATFEQQRYMHASLPSRVPVDKSYWSLRLDKHVTNVIDFSTCAAHGEEFATAKMCTLSLASHNPGTLTPSYGMYFVAHSHRAPRANNDKIDIAYPSVICTYHSMFLPSSLIHSSLSATCDVIHCGSRRMICVCVRAFFAAPLPVTPHPLTLIRGHP
jgi:hypothetical protein